tara:strand:- start:1049 stop:1915 length:867 start_codon:yes stop_codon:yes gene_type:complete
MNGQLLNKKDIESIVKLALVEDSAFNDLTTNNLIPNDRSGKFILVANEEGIISGLELFQKTMQEMSNKIQITHTKNDGDNVKPAEIILELTGPINKILSGERVGLNFLQMLSGISSLTNQFIQKINSNKIVIRDTRKTRPLLRKLEKYAVTQGGGQNHRNTLEDFILIKDNHLHWAKKNGMQILEIIKNYKEKFGESYTIEIEVESITDAEEALKSNADILLLDNMHVKEIEKVCRLKSKLKSKSKIEISGGINLTNIEQYADYDIDYIAIGALIHSAKFFDFSLEIS